MSEQPTSDVEYPHIEVLARGRRCGCVISAWCAISMAFCASTKASSRSSVLLAMDGSCGVGNFFRLVADYLCFDLRVAIRQHQSLALVLLPYPPSFEWTDELAEAGVRISVYGQRRWIDIRMISRCLKYECGYLNAFQTSSEV